jgi:hypothetical protein
LFKTGDRGHNPTIGHNPWQAGLFTSVTVSFPPMWTTLKEKRTKKEKLIIVIVSMNNTILQI